MVKRKSIICQGADKLMSMAAFGDSKHEDKKLNGGFPAREKIYSSKTMDNYIDCVARFLHWAREMYGCRFLEEARVHVPEYLNQRMLTKSAWTVRTEAAAIAKLYQVGMNDLGVVLPKRSRDDISQHREQKWIGHFAPNKHEDLVAFALSSGLRLREIRVVAPEDVYEAEGYVYIDTVGKGGKFRSVRCLDDEPLRIAQVAAAEGKERIFDQIPKYAPMHEYRGLFAQTWYERLARPLKDIPVKERYICRGKKKGIIYDKNAMAFVSLQLGHHRLDVVADHYLY